MNKNFLPKVLLGGTLLLLASCSGGGSTSTTLESAGTTITIGGSSEVYEVLEILTEAYSAHVEGIKFEFLPPSQTDGGILGVKTEILDIGVVSRDLADDEREGALTTLPLVQVPLVLVAHESVTGVTNLSTEQVIAIYSGKITNWKDLGGPNANIVLLDLAEDENEKKVLRQAVLGEDLAITKTAIVFAEDDELLNTAAITDFSFAAIPFEDDLNELPVTTLSLDGIEPSTAKIQSGEYGMALSLGIVLPQRQSPEIKAFVEFVMSPEAQDLLREAEYVVAGAKS